MNTTIRKLALSLLLALPLPSALAQKVEPPSDVRQRLQKAEALFQERCKTAGEKIHKTVDNVEGIFLMKIRPSKINYQDQFERDDPYGRDLGGEGYIGSFLNSNLDTSRPKNPRPGWPPRVGYRYVEALDPVEGKRYRYTGSMKVVGRKNPNTPNHQIELQRNPNFDLNNYAFVLDKTPAPGPQPRYGVTYDDISTHEDRQYWIAGSSLKVVDLKTNEVIAERIGYMVDRGQGSISAGRSPWLLAANNACPDFHRFPNPVVVVPGSSAQQLQTLDFVEKVLKPKQGN